MTIAEVSKKYGLPIDTLRYYERINLIPPVRRTKGGIRDYGETDCRWVEFVKCMRAASMPVEVLADYVQLCLKGESTISARIDLLKEQRERVETQFTELKQILNKLNSKIDNYEDALLQFEKQLASPDPDIDIQ